MFELEDLAVFIYEADMDLEYKEVLLEVIGQLIEHRDSLVSEGQIKLMN